MDLFPEADIWNPALLNETSCEGVTVRPSSTWQVYWKKDSGLFDVSRFIAIPALSSKLNKTKLQIAGCHGKRRSQHSSSVISDPYLWCVEARYCYLLTIMCGVWLEEHWDHRMLLRKAFMCHCYGFKYFWTLYILHEWKKILHSYYYDYYIFSHITLETEITKFTDIEASLCCLPSGEKRRPRHLTWAST